MSATLTRRERVMRTIRFQPVDRIATYDILENDGVIEHYAGEPATPINGDRVKGKAIGRCLDMTRMPEGPRKEALLDSENGLRYKIERWTTWIVERPFHDLETLIPWIKRHIAQLNAWQPDAEFIASFHEYIRRHQLFFAAGCEVRDDVPVLVMPSHVGVDHMHSLVGLELFSLLTMCEPDLMEEWFESIHQAELRRVHAVADAALMPIVLTHDDIASKNGPLFSPDWLRRYEIPRLKALVNAWHAHDTICLFHSDGNLMPILDDLVSTGIDGLNPLETLAGMSIHEVRARYGDRLFLTGGIDVSQLMEHGTPEEVRARCQEAIAEADGMGYFLGSTTEILPSLPPENAIAMLETPKLLAQPT